MDLDNKENNNASKIRETIKIDEKMQETIELSRLYDFYGDLLTDKNKDVFEEYILNDLSLTEIAEQKGITRQGIYDIVRRSSKKIREYEDSLHLVKKFKSIKEKINQIQDYIDELKLIDTENSKSNKKFQNTLDKINDLTNEILQEL